MFTFDWAMDFALDAFVAVADILGILLNSIGAFTLVIALFFAAALVGAFFIPIMGHANPAGSDGTRRLASGKTRKTGGDVKRISLH